MRAFTEKKNTTLRPLLWGLLVLSAAGNAGTSFGGTSPALHIAFGVVTVACALALVVLRVRRSPRP